MVEPATGSSRLRTFTPTPTHRTVSSPSRQNSIDCQQTSPQASFVNNHTPSFHISPSSHLPPIVSLSSSRAFHSSMGDVRENMIDPAAASIPENASQLIPSRQRSNSQPHQAQNTSSYSSFSATPSSALRPDGRGIPLPGTTHDPYPSVGVMHGHASGYPTQPYVIPPQPTMTHTLPYGYSYHPGVPEGAVIPLNPHGHYPPILQPPLYYQGHSPDTFQGNYSSSLHVDPQLMSPHGQSISAIGADRAHLLGRGPFQPLPYQAPLSHPQYNFPSQSFQPSPPVYQPQSYPADGRGAWYYLPHSPRQYSDGGPIGYQASHYPIAYPSMTNPEIDSPYPIPIQQGPQGSQGHSAYATLGVQGVAPLTTLNSFPSKPSSSHLHTHGFGPSSARNNPDPGIERSVSTTETSSATEKLDKPLIRKPYHPNPAPCRSEWVMWTGNIPSDATQDELWSFFTAPEHMSNQSVQTQSQSGMDGESANGVLSIFLISKSSCAFVNYETEEHLNSAIRRFNAKALRPHERSIKLVCRVRRKDDDLKAGVGGQRGQGVHSKWVKEQRKRDMEVLSPDVGGSSQEKKLGERDLVDNLTVQTSNLRVENDIDEEGKQKMHRSSSGSYASTDSSLLATNFPQRYFILKSLTQYDLDLSVRNGLWATQKHNEGILDQAYRTSRDVFLIFGVNKSGEFYGYARMAGPMQRGERNVAWASRGKESASQQPLQPTAGDSERSIASSGSATQQSGFYWPTPRTRLVDASTGGVIDPKAGVEDDGDFGDSTQDPVKTPGPGPTMSSAPAEMGNPHTQITMPTLDVKSSTLHNFQLDPRAPLRAAHNNADDEDGDLPDAGKDNVGQRKGSSSRRGAETWGDCFPIEWLCTDRLPFHWTRHLRNPWNHEREVKVSRDGTELEPHVGRMLLKAWETMRASGQAPPVGRPPSFRPD